VTARYLLDTNVLLRAVQEEADDHTIAISAISLLAGRGEDLVVTPQVLIEFWSVATRPTDVNGLGWSVQLVDEEVTRLLDQFPMLVDRPEVFAHWLQIVRSHEVKGKRVHDARLVAIMRAHRVAHLLTFNVDDFKGHPDMTIVHPRDVS
jgi:predicted nucleic acid-binding protein